MKKLVRTRSNRKVAGVLGGLSRYMGVDPAIIRVAFVILLLITGLFPMGLLYLVAVFVIQNEEDVIH